VAGDRHRRSGDTLWDQARGTFMPLRLPATKPSKYHAQPVVIDGVRFASKREGARYAELKLLKKAGEIRELTLQPRYVLHAPLLEEDGTVLALKRLGEFRADFRYVDVATGATIVEDAKGVDVRLGRWKRRHAEAQYGLEVRLT
jgi:hypothetical protein